MKCAHDWKPISEVASGMLDISPQKAWLRFEWCPGCGSIRRVDETTGKPTGYWAPKLYSDARKRA